MTALRVAVVDDEPLARERLRTLLAAAGATIAGEAASVRDAVRLIRRELPDVVLLDIELPDGTGFDVIAELDIDEPPLIIVVTAFDSYAVRAFDVAAVDYVLKPIDPARLLDALERAAARARAPRDESRAARLLALASAFNAARASQRLVLRENGRSVFVDPAGILWVESKRNNCLVHLVDRTIVVRETLAGFQTKLPGTEFVRAHRSAVVNMAHVRYAEPYFRGEFVLVLSDGTKVTTSRTHGHEIHRLLAAR